MHKNKVSSMNRILIITLLISFVIIFFLGLFIGVYKFFPYSELNDITNQLQSKTSDFDNHNLDSVNLENLVSIQNTNDLNEKRNQLIQFIWKTNTLPKQLPNFIDTNISDERFSNFSNLKQIDRLTINMEHGLSSIVYVFSPENHNGSLILYHQGHSGGFINGKSTIQKFLDNGFTVAAFSMPLIGLNNQPVIELENIGEVKFFKHNQFVYLESETFSSMSYFFTPLSITLNYLSTNPSFENFHMVGISGGGWATTVYPSLDTRITKSFSIAGSLPLSLRTIVDDVGDYEQYHPEFYSIANYLDIYTMSSSGNGREHIQIFNKYDPCCFAGNNLSHIHDSIQQSITSFDSGNFEIIIDDSHNEHKISNSISEFILEKLT